MERLFASNNKRLRLKKEQLQIIEEVRRKIGMVITAIRQEGLRPQTHRQAPVKRPEIPATSQHS